MNGEEKNGVGCFSVFNWTIDQFTTEVKKLSNEGNISFKSPKFQTWWNDLWEVSITFCYSSTIEPFCGRTENYTIETNFNLLKDANEFENVKLRLVETATGTIFHDSTNTRSVLCNKTNHVTSLFSREVLRFRVAITLYGTQACETTPCTVSSVFSFRRDIASLWEKGLMSDLVISVGDQTVKANKIVLAAVSPVFQAMFEHDCREKQTNCIEIRDIDVDTVKEMLHFIYTGEQPDFKNIENALKLYYASEKYQLTVLKELCKNYITVKFILSTEIEDELSKIASHFRLND